MQTPPLFRYLRWNVLLAAMFPALLFAQSSPVLPDFWSNPEFQKRVLGSFGVRSEVEPEPFEREEARFFNENLLPVVQLGEYAQAIGIIEQNLTPESNPNLHFILGTLYLQQDNRREAIRAYRNAIQKFPDYLRAHKNLGIALSQENRFEQAIQSLSKALELGDSSGDTFGLLAYNYFSTQQFNRALDAYRMATLLDPENNDWMIGKTQSLIETGNFAEAAQSALELLERDPQKTSLWLTKANAHIGLEDYEQAILSLEMARLHASPPLQSLILLGDLYATTGLTPLAVDAYVAGVAKGMKSNTVLRILSYLIGNGELDASRKFLASPGLDPDSWVVADKEEFLVLQSRLELASGNSREAMALLEKVVEANPTNGSALLQLGNFHSDDGNIEEALYFCDRVIALNNSRLRFEALVQKATLLVELKDYREARAAVRSALAIRDEDRLVRYLEALDRIIEREG